MMKPHTRIVIAVLLALMMGWRVVDIRAQGGEDTEGYSYIIFPSPGFQVLDVQTREHHVITEQYLGDNPYWSPDGQRIVFRSFVLEGQGNSNLYVLDIDGSRFIEIPMVSLPSKCRLGNWRWTPDGENIAFSCPQGDDPNSTTLFNILFVSSDGRLDLEDLPFDISVQCQWFDFSRNGELLVCGGSDRETRTDHVTIIDMSSGEIIAEHIRDWDTNEYNRQVVGIDVMDNDRILVWAVFPSHFEIIDFGGESLYLSQTGLMEQLPLSESTWVRPSPNGTEAVFGAENVSLATINFETEAVEILYTSDDGNWIAHPDWSPLLDRPLDLPVEPYTIEYLCGLLEESGSHCSKDILSQ